MPLVAEYHRPATIAEALSLLQDGERVPLAGGTTINADRDHGGAKVVDLQALDLAGIMPIAGHVHIGAMATLADVADNELVPTALQDIARAEEPSTLRTLATVGGAIASRNPDSVLLAALLAQNAEVGFAGDADERMLSDVLTNGLPTGVLITDVTFYPADSLGVATTGRTPADVPIVAAVAARNGPEIALALTGVAPTPVLVDPADPAAGLDPSGDFRGSSAYRTRLAAVLSARAIGALA